LNCAAAKEESNELRDSGNQADKILAKNRQKR
jgi:hypothetical protein